MEGLAEMSLAQRYWTVDDLHDLPDDHGWRYEAIDGRLQVNPPALIRHQLAAGGLYRQLAAQATPDWTVLHELGIRLGTDWRQPDLLVVETPSDTERFLFEPHEVGLVIEVVSFSSRRTDRVVKPAEYAAAGIPRYWRVETDPVVELHAYELVDGRYVPGPPRAPFPVEVDVGALGP